MSHDEDEIVPWPVFVLGLVINAFMLALVCWAASCIFGFKL